MRSWLLIIGLIISVLTGGNAFAMARHDCHHRTPSTDAMSGAAMTFHHAPKPAKPAGDCCAGTGVCRMAGCAPLASLPAERAMPLAGRAEVFHQVAAPALKGRFVPPQHGPPRPLLS